MYTGFGARTRQRDVCLCTCFVFLRCDTWRQGWESQNATAPVWDKVRTDPTNSSLKMKRDVSCSGFWRVWFFSCQQPITFIGRYARTPQTGGGGGGSRGDCRSSVDRHLKITTCVLIICFSVICLLLLLLFIRTMSCLSCNYLHPTFLLLFK